MINAGFISSQSQKGYLDIILLEMVLDIIMFLHVRALN